MYHVLSYLFIGKENSLFLFFSLHSGRKSKFFLQECFRETITIYSVGDDSSKLSLNLYFLKKRNNIEREKNCIAKREMGLEGKEAKGNGKQSRKDNECKSTSDWRSREINPFQLLKKLVYSRMHCVILVVGCVSLGCEILGDRSRLLQRRSNEQKPLTDTTDTVPGRSSAKFQISTTYGTYDAILVSAPPKK